MIRAMCKKLFLRIISVVTIRQARDEIDDKTDYDYDLYSVYQRGFHGMIYTVCFGSDGMFHYGGKLYHSLNDVARIITGDPHISGPKFLGVLNRTRSAAAGWRSK